MLLILYYSEFIITFFFIESQGAARSSFNAVATGVAIAIIAIICIAIFAIGVVIAIFKFIIPKKKKGTYI